MIKFIKILSLVLYYSFLIYLPTSSTPVIGKLIEKLRYFCCKIIFKKCGKNVNIEKGAYFGNGFNIEIGDNSGIGKKAKVPANIIIGKNVMMGNNITIFSASHRIDRTDIPMIKQGSIKYPAIIIEDDVWIGQGVIIMPKVSKIASGTVIGAGSVVTKEFPEYSIIGGNPAKLIKLRK
jgi:maltose O-acetyltransferase